MDNIKKCKSIVLLIFSLLLLIGCDLNYGFIDTEFSLAQESRLPKWFELPSKYSKSDITVTIISYISWSGMKTRVVVRGPAPEYEVLMDKVGTEKVHPVTEQRGYDKYPLYSIVTIDGVEEIIEQRKPEDIVYISDDPKLTSVK